MPSKTFSVAIVYPVDAGERASAKLDNSRFAATAEALAAAGLEVEGAPYADEAVEDVRAQLLRVDAALVWINPIQGGRDRSVLNAMLREVAAKGILVSTHPDIIDRMGTKEVLYATRSMSWGCDTRLYRTLNEMRAALRASLAEGHPRVIKRIRGHSGEGVWKVELAEPRDASRSTLSSATLLRVRHAKRGSLEERMPLDALATLFAPYFEGSDGMVDQAYQPRLTDGMVRCYLVGDRVAGFGEQLVNALYPAAPGAPANEAPQAGPRLYYPPTRPDFQRLKDKLEREWLGEMCSLLGVKRDALPILWDADFLYGPKDTQGHDTHVLCEINVSSVYPYPESAQAPLAAETLARIERRRA